MLEITDVTNGTVKRDILQLPARARQVNWNTGTARKFKDAFVRRGIDPDEWRDIVKRVNDLAKSETDFGVLTLDQLIDKVAPPPAISALNMAIMTELEEATKIIVEESARKMEKALDTIMRSSGSTDMHDGLHEELWERIIAMSLLVPVAIDGTVFLDPARMMTLVQVSKFFQAVVGRILSRYASVYLEKNSPESPLVDQMSREQYGWVKATAEALITAHGPDEHAYIFPGGSLAPVAVYLKQWKPDARIVFLPVSGLAGELGKSAPKLDADLVAIFYHYYLAGLVNLVFDKKQKLVVADYSSSGQSVSIICSNLDVYFSRLGLTKEDAKALVHKFGITSKLKQPSLNLSDSDWTRFVDALKHERMKDKDLVVFKKPRGYVFDAKLQSRQRPNPTSFMKLWLAVQHYLGEEKTPVNPEVIVGPLDGAAGQEPTTNQTADTSQKVPNTSIGHPGTAFGPQHTKCGSLVVRGKHNHV